MSGPGGLMGWWWDVRAKEEEEGRRNAGLSSRARRVKGGEKRTGIVLGMQVRMHVDSC